MHLNRILITREGYIGAAYGRPDPSKPLRATIEVEGPMGKTEINLPPETSDRIIALIADELAEQSRKVAEAMTAKFIESASAPMLAKEI